MSSRFKGTAARAGLALGLVLAAMIIPACNTFAGMGQDVQAIGGHVTGAAENVQNEMSR